MILTLAGELESGKDTIAGYLKGLYGFEPVSIADNLKQMCMRVFSLSHNQCYTTQGKEEDLANSIFLNDQHITDIIYWLERENKWGLTHDQILDMRAIGREDHVFRTARQTLQFVGTEILRECVDPTFSIKYLTKKLYDNLDKDFVVTDGRFEDERMFLKENLGAKNVLIRCPQNELKHKKDTHRSENDLGKSEDYDYVFINDKSKGLEHCQDEVEKMHKFFRSKNAKSRSRV